MLFIPSKPEMLGLFKKLNELLGDAKLNNPEIFPDFSKAKTILSVSDYSGENLKEKYQAYSFFIFDYNNSGIWNKERLLFRKGVMSKRNMEFKKMKDNIKLSKLSEYLKMFNSIDGIIATLAIDNNIQTIFEHENLADTLRELNLGDYKEHIAEKILRIIHFNMFLVSGLTNSSHDFMWYSDRDSSMEKNLNEFINLYGRIFEFYSPHKFNKFGFAKSFDENKEYPFDDFQSLADLTAGATIEYLNSIDETSKNEKKKKKLESS